MEDNYCFTEYNVYPNSMYSKIVIYSKVVGTYNGGLQCPHPPNPQAAKLTSQGDARVRTSAQIKFLCYPLTVY